MASDQPEDNAAPAPQPAGADLEASDTGDEGGDAGNEAAGGGSGSGGGGGGGGGGEAGPGGGPGEKWVTIWKARNGPEANLAMLALQARGHAARVDFENTATLGAWAGAGPGTATGVQVLASDAQAARAVIDQLEHNRRSRREAEGWKYTRCGAHRVKRAIPSQRWIGAALVIIGIVLSAFDAMICVPVTAIGILLLTWPFTPRWRCRACGNAFSAPDPEDLEEEQLPEPGEETEAASHAEVEPDSEPPSQASGN